MKSLTRRVPDFFNTLLFANPHEFDRVAARPRPIEVVQATRAVDVAKANLGVSEKSREIARQSARLSRIAFAAGQGSSFDLVDSARRLREAEIDTAIKEFELVRARIAALLALASCDV